MDESLEEDRMPRTARPAALPERHPVTARAVAPEPLARKARDAAHTGDEADALDPHLVSLVSPRSFEAEHYRALRARLEARGQGRAHQVVAVTSAAIGDGKTTTAINLAGALAQARDARVLLVDADLRRPSVETQIGWQERGGPGLVDAILDPERTLQSVVRRITALNLSIATAGRETSSPYEALKSERLGELFDEMRRDYDYVVVDTPPVIPVPDCRLLSRWVDGFLMVVAAHRTPRELVAEGLGLLEQATVIGMVFNGDQRPHSGYYGRYLAYAQSSRRTARVPPSAPRSGARPAAG